MISRHLWNRLKRLQDKIKPRCEPKATPKQRQLVERLNAAIRRIAEEDGVDYVEPAARAELIFPLGVDPTVIVLHAARKRVNAENARLEQEAADGGDGTK
jgi:TRAP-type C4-dicarboxylate transport system substrate-binding protein